MFGETVACPLHNWNIELGTGCAVAPDVGCAKKYSVKVENGDVYLDLNELTAPASRAEAALGGQLSVLPHVEAA